MYELMFYYHLLCMRYKLNSQEIVRLNFDIFGFVFLIIKCFIYSMKNVYGNYNWYILYFPC